MARQAKKCWECKKWINSGKYYTFYEIGELKLRGVELWDYCPLCVDKDKNGPLKSRIDKGYITIIEKEIGKKIDDDVREFEDKWKKYGWEDFKFSYKDFDNTKLILAWCQEARKQLEPYLQKLEIVEKAFGGYKHTMRFWYLFAKSGHDKDYCQKVVNKTISEICGQPMPEIDNNRENEMLWTNFRKQFDYEWVKHYDRRLVFFSAQDNKLALQAYLRALAIKERELTENTKPIETDKPSYQEKNISNSANQPKSPNWTLIIVLGITGAAVITGLVIYFLKNQNHSKK
ncbi:MAG: hypothetical protein MRECE_8c013 [Mycoplasmataceae bacterium CE_OT135]|nr:MAG: hypothetical protein MRECE_8c013 [Mycoplasmataceae bacterium CE_OT135]